MFPPKPLRSGRSASSIQIAVILGCLAVVGLSRLSCSRWGETSDLVICEHLEMLYDNFKNLRDESASSVDWDEFAERATTNTAPYVSELNRTATALRPVRQRLLFLTRDHLPKMLRTSRQQPSSDEESFAALLAEVRTMLSGELPESMQADPDHAE